MYGYIYITTNVINGKRYIGQHKADNFTDSYKGSGKYLHNAINKYGWDNFKVELLEECNNQEELNKREIYWIKFYDAVKSPNYYNITPGGNNYNPYKGLSEEEYRNVSKKISESQVGKRWMNNGIREVRVLEQFVPEYLSQGYVYGQLQSHRNIGERNGMYKSTHTPEVRAKLSKCNTLSNNPSYGKHWYTNGKTNIFIYEQDLENYPGYYRGRVRGWFKGAIFINDGIVNKAVTVDDYNDNYNKSIWKRGIVKGRK